MLWGLRSQAMEALCGFREARQVQHSVAHACIMLGRPSQLDNVPGPAPVNVLLLFPSLSDSLCVECSSLQHSNALQCTLTIFV
jgi:hypothetical protein